MTTVSLDAVRKDYGKVTALNNLSTTFTAHRITAIIGRSGCGKSTLLQMCNGLVRPDKGTVNIFDQALNYNALPTLRRKIGYAVQGVGLFPHLNVSENISLLADLEGWTPAATGQRIEQLLELMQLDTSLLTHYPHQLSGGQQQRVGLCRAMMLSPELLLLDEPFAAIDPLTRMDIHQQLLALHRAEPTTTLLVTHDMQEALLLADDIVVMDKGEIIYSSEKSLLAQQYPNSTPNQLLLSLMSGELT